MLVQELQPPDGALLADLASVAAFKASDRKVAAFAFLLGCNLHRDEVGSIRPIGDMYNRQLDHDSPSAAHLRFKIAPDENEPSDRSWE